MAVRNVLHKIRLDLLHKLYFQKFKAFNCTQKLFYSSETHDDFSEKKLSEYSKAFIKQSHLIDSMKENEKQSHLLDSMKENEESFATLLRKSKFIDLGDPVGKIVVGTIYRVVENDLYIDFGWKFPTVCSKPKKNNKSYIRGAKVVLLIKDLELSTKFLGSDNNTTLLEADCKLLGLALTEEKEFNYTKDFMSKILEV